jgi:arylsulfatase
VASATYPEERGGRRIQPAEGRSLVPAFRGEAVDREAIYWEHEGNAAVRVGDLKLVRAGRTGAWELYDLAADRTEQHDLAAERPAEVAALAARWQSWAERVHAEPAPERPKKKR